MTTFTNILPDTYDSDKGWYFVWHAPDPTATASGPAWDENGKYYVKVLPDESRQRGTGMPVPSNRLGLYARLNREGQRWGWMPMEAFAAWMEGRPPVSVKEEDLERFRIQCTLALGNLGLVQDRVSKTAAMLDLALRGESTAGGVKDAPKA